MWRLINYKILFFTLLAIVIWEHGHGRILLNTLGNRAISALRNQLSTIAVNAEK